jgi:hypothetical protein
VGFFVAAIADRRFGVAMVGRGGLGVVAPPMVVVSSRRATIGRWSGHVAIDVTTFVTILV